MTQLMFTNSWKEMNDELWSVTLYNIIYDTGSFIFCWDQSFKLWSESAVSDQSLRLVAANNNNNNNNNHII